MKKKPYSPPDPTLVAFEGVAAQAQGRLNREPAKPAVRVDEANFEEHIMGLLKSKQNLHVATFRAPDGSIYYDIENQGNSFFPVPNPLPPITNETLKEVPHKEGELTFAQMKLIEECAGRKFFVGDFPETDTGKMRLPMIPISPPEDRVHRAGVNYTELIAQVAREWATAKIREGYTPTISKAGLQLVEHKLAWLVEAERHRWSPSTYQPPEPDEESE